MHHEPRVIEAMEKWWSEIEKGSRRYLSYTFRGIFAPMPTLDTHVTPQEEQGV